jgi:hypothetical protein
MRGLNKRPGPEVKAGVLAILSGLAVFNFLRRLSRRRKP